MEKGWQVITVGGSHLNLNSSLTYVKNKIILILKTP